MREPSSILVHGGVSFFTAKHEARQLGVMADVLQINLIDAGAGLNPPAGSQRRAESRYRLRTMDIALEASAL